MVFEQLFKLKPIKPTTFNIFLMGFLFSEIGILASLLAFYTSASLMSIAFTALLLLPFLLDLFQYQKIAIDDQTGFLRRIFTNNRVVIKTYLLLFLGFLLSYALFSILLPDFSTVTLFGSQLGVFGLVGKATSGITFVPLLLNNARVFLACFVFSLIFGVGSILFLVWNASVWGAVLGYIAKQASLVLGQNPFLYFLSSFLAFLPHLITEAASYFFAIIAGVIIGQTIIYERTNKRQFVLTLREGLALLAFGLILLPIAAAVEAYLFPLYA